MTHYYFDHNATTPVCAPAREACMNALDATFGNASSIHAFGQSAKMALETARRQVAGLLGCDAKEVVFTSGGTEADNLAILGTVRASQNSKRHVVTSAIEHPAVTGACQELQREGVAVTYVGCSRTGVVDPDDVARAITDDTVLVSVMHANNETGVLQPVEEIARIANERGVAFHSDGVQAAGKMAAANRAGLYAISAHKLYAPKGVGALRVQAGALLAPQMVGGHHERERRAGTENIPGIVALGAAAEWLNREGATINARIATLRDRLEQRILATVPDCAVNGAGAARVPNTTNMRFDGISGEALVIALDLAGFAVSTGSACSSGAIEPSHVLAAMGLTDAQAWSSIRISLGADNTESQVDALAGAVAEAATRLRSVAPVYNIRVL